MYCFIMWCRVLYNICTVGTDGHFLIKFTAKNPIALPVAIWTYVPLPLWSYVHYRVIPDHIIEVVNFISLTEAFVISSS